MYSIVVFPGGSVYNKTEGGEAMNRKKLKILPNLPKMLFQRVVMVGISILAQVAVFALMIWRFKDQNDI